MTQISRLFTFVLLFFCFVQLVSSTPFESNAAVVAVENKKANLAVVSTLYLPDFPPPYFWIIQANAAQTSRNAVATLSVAVAVAAGGVLSSLL
ncbi:hypothetical protein PILCRDRAFT_7931 [Piloderma croceum F 1598]|uniref:Transmembrane protein n=1 Tax=Piloderma croceum (strain F 1598) TaxID=765440 RepID=A0A0C3BYV3_PILCF|nr:hypothetical protein PILCRDRAFT_7931 [Piloderma croceum F 1598]